MNFQIRNFTRIIETFKYVIILYLLLDMAIPIDLNDFEKSVLSNDISCLDHSTPLTSSFLLSKSSCKAANAFSTRLHSGSKSNSGQSTKPVNQI